ncbi:hypothetical protein KNO30_04790 [Taylorella equigenitalis]|uniref:hypothetical protein n=1 Tax=Taylorella equigenitalis TaxID=29575 RepID=UPI0003FE6A6F|nr:hypothetical protein [Taylorella equigenitalis]ASY30693.1 hypothetical protein B9Z30_04830 [Taylorella equigenitalis]KOS58304.1 hypothetical protein AM589_07620 [Taylorella equigenitalis]WDU47371.1 hypothetical protein KNO30_04790 [Taylorella equigenitalis]
MSTYLQNQDPRFFKLVRADDEHLYTGRFPLSESEAMPVDNVQIDDDAIIVNKKSVSEIVFHFYLQPEIKELIQIFI